jgi:hypothetical protein
LTEAEKSRAADVVIMNVRMILSMLASNELVLDDLGPSERQPAGRPAPAVSTQSEPANPGVRPAVLNRQAETGKRLMSGAQALGIFVDVLVTHPRRDQIVACDVIGRPAGELIGFFNDVVVALEQRQDVFNSTLHVVEVMRAGRPARCLLELGKDEMEKAFDMGREHREALITAAALPAA